MAALIESGCLNVGALMGSHMTEEQMAGVKFISSQVTIPKVTVFLDRDEAGIAGAEKAVALLRTSGFSAEAFDWNHVFKQLGADLVEIPTAIRDPGDMSVRHLQWLRTQDRI